MNKIDNIIAKDLCAISIEIGHEFDIDISKIVSIMDQYFVKNYDKDLKIDQVFQAIKNFKNPTLKGQTKLVKVASIKPSLPGSIPGVEKPKSEPSGHGKCLFKNRGIECTITPKDNQLFCAKHKSTKFASTYMASLPDPDYKIPKMLPPIIRNKSLKVWIVENTDLIVESPSKKVVIGNISNKKVSKKLTVKNKKLATDLKLKIDPQISKIKKES